MIDRVLVYRLYEPGELAERDAMLERYLAAVGPGRPIDPTYLSIGAGCFRWSDRGRLDRNDQPDQLAKHEEEARQQAVEYMRAANEAANRHRADRGLDRETHPDPFPLANLVPTSTARVRSRRRGHDDHWLTTWSLLLPSTVPSSRSPVMGATIELRVGARGQVVSVVSRARPWRAVLTRPALAWKDDDGNHGTSKDPPLVYVTDQPGEPLRFLAPCWLIAPEHNDDHHARRLWPASDHTVLPEIVIEEDRGEATTWAAVAAPGGKSVVPQHGREWKLRWTVATLEQFIDGKATSSEGTNARLDGEGLYQVVLEIEHVATRAIRSTHRQVSIMRRDSDQVPASPDAPDTA